MTNYALDPLKMLFYYTKMANEAISVLEPVGDPSSRVPILSHPVEYLITRHARACKVLASV